MTDATRPAWWSLPMAAYTAALIALPSAYALIALAAALSSIAVAWRRDSAIDGLPGAWSIALPFGFYLAWLAVAAAAGASPPKSAGNALFFGLCMAGGILWAALGAPVRACLTGAVPGAIGGALLAAWQVHVEGAGRAHGWLGVGAVGSGAIKFGDLSALLGVLSLVLAWHARDRAGRLLGVAGTLAGLAALHWSGARGGALALMMTVVTLAAVDVLGRRATPGATRRIGVAAAAAVMLIGATQSERLANLHDEWSVGADAATTSMGARLALWRAALDHLQAHPWTGVGLERFSEATGELVAQGRAPAAIVVFDHAHNEYLCALARGGLFFGVVVTLALVSPAVVCLRRSLRLRRTPPVPDPASLLVVDAATAGTVAFACFALTDCIFDRQITIVSYAVVGGFLCVASGRRMAAR